MRTHASLFVIFVLACTGTPSGGGPADERGADQSRPRDLGGGGDGAGQPDAALPCIGLTDCACLAQKDVCQPITEPCYCQFPQCGAGACLCGGGKYFGCAPRSSGCESPITCRPAGRVTGPDARGCFACVYQTACEAAWKQLVDKLRSGPDCPLPDALIEGFSCAKNPACVTRCINEVNTCKDIGCGLCLRCGCPTQGAFERCFYECQK